MLRGVKHPSIATTLALLLSSAAALVARAELIGNASPGAQVPAGYRQVVTRTNQLEYLLYLPKDYATDASAKFPLVLFLHGAGERGSDLQKVAVHGPPKMVKAGRDFPFILVSPQCPEGRTWDDAVLIGLLDELQAKYRVNPRQIYVTGLSMGGYGS